MTILLKIAIERYSKTVLIHKSVENQPRQLTQLRWFEKHLGNVYVDKIQRKDLIYVRDLLLVEKKSNSTVNRYMAALSHLFTILTNDWECINESPFRKIKKLKEPRGRSRYLNNEELQILLEKCKNSYNQYLYLIVRILVATGARRNEICNLKWTDVDLNKGYITLYKTKNGDIRRLPINTELVHLLQQYHNPNNIYVFQSNKYVKPLNIQTAWKSVLKLCGFKDFRMHDLRHTCASYLAMNGANSLDIATILGHKSLDMVKRYSHLSNDHVDKVLLDMNNKMI